MSTTGPEHARVFVTDVQWLDDRASGTVNACQAGVERTLAQVRRWHPRLSNASPEELRGISIDDGRLVQAREHGFDTWQDFVDYLGALARGDRREPFLDVFEAMRHRADRRRATATRGGAGSAARLGHQQHHAPEPGRQSRRQAARRVDGGRMGTTGSIIAGSDVNPGNHRGWTPLHQAATPAMMDRLIGAGANVGAEAHASGGTPLAVRLFWAIGQLPRRSPHARSCQTTFVSRQGLAARISWTRVSPRAGS